jgi:hypothetical protein
VSGSVTQWRCRWGTTLNGGLVKAILHNNHTTS